MKNILALLFLSINFLYGQEVTINTFPKNKQIYKRSLTSNQAEVISSGNVNENSGYTSLILEVYKNDILQNTYTQALIYTSNIANFSFSTFINAELSNYTFKLIANTGHVLKEVKEVAAGDVYILTGQSNSLGYTTSDPKPPYNNHFVRSMTRSGFWSDNINSVVFGEIGYLFSEQIVLNHNIPIALINGGAPGKRIEFFQKNYSDGNNSSNNYHILKQWYSDAGFLPGDVRAIIWYQGEANVNTTDTKSFYLNQFSSLYADWVVDYDPNNFYLFQVRKGCGINTFATEIPEAHRSIGLFYDDVQCIATNGAEQGTDLCHFFGTNGYQEFAERLYKLVAFDLYDSGVNSGIYSPNISTAFFTDTKRDQIKFSLYPATDNFIYEDGVESDFKIENSTVTVTSGSVSGNIVTLNLSASVTEDNPKLTYLGHNPEASPFIKNQNGIGMFSFKDIPIETYGVYVSAPVGASNYQWYHVKDDNSVNMLDGASTVNYWITDAGIYYATYDTGAACSAVSDYIVVKDNCDDAAIILSLGVNTGSFQWYNEHTTLSGQTNATLSVVATNTPTKYYAIETTCNQEFPAFTVVNLIECNSIPLAIDKPDNMGSQNISKAKNAYTLEEAKMEVIPNLVSESTTFKVNYYLPKEEVIHLSIINMNGQLFQEHQLKPESGWNTFEIKASNLVAGMYYLQSDQGLVKRFLVIEN